MPARLGGRDGVIEVTSTAVGKSQGTIGEGHYKKGHQVGLAVANPTIEPEIQGGFRVAFFYPIHTEVKIGAKLKAPAQHGVLKPLLVAASRFERLQR
jgi:hypothetical protein